MAVADDPLDEAYEKLVAYFKSKGWLVVGQLATLGDVPEEYKGLAKPPATIEFE